MKTRRDLVTRIYEEGIKEIGRLQLVEYGGRRFFEKIELRTGMTKGARGGCRNGTPFVYFGLRGRGFDKATTLCCFIETPGYGAVWKQATELAKRREWLYVEYSHIHKDPEIGGFISDNPEDHIRALMAHELAHAVHWWTMHVTKDRSEKTVHGAQWRRLYRTLRVEWVNPKIKS